MKERMAIRCAICKAIELDGRLIPASEYKLEKLALEGVRFSDTFLSRECIKKYYEDFATEEMLALARYDRCTNE